MTTIEKKPASTEKPQPTKESETLTPATPEVKDKSHPSPPEKENWQEKYIRLYAEFENAQKRMQRDQLIWYRMANKELMLDLLATLDDLERAMTNVDIEKDNQKEIQKGLNLIYTNLLEKLTKKGLQSMEVEIGRDPNPQEHHILTKINTENEALKGKIAKIVTKGYMLHDQVIRHAQILIGT